MKSQLTGLKPVQLTELETEFGEIIEIENVLTKLVNTELK